MLFCQAWIAIMATRSNLAIPQTFPLEKPCSSNIGLMCYLVFWMSLYKDYLPPVRNTHEFLGTGSLYINELWLFLFLLTINLLMGIVQKIEAPSHPPNQDVLSYDILGYLRPPLPRLLICTISRKKVCSKNERLESSTQQIPGRKMILY